MQQFLKNRLFSIIIFAFAVLGFATLRLYQEQIFNDPFIHFFKTNYHSNSYPEIAITPFYGSMILRYLLNTFLSLMVIYTLFKSKDILKFVLFLYAFLGLILLFLLIWEIHFSEIKSTFFLFYTRRFLIQPLFLLLFIPALYFQKKSKQ
jgi:exosortase F-associated protein